MNKNKLNFQGKAAIVTGGTRGIGRTIVQSLVDQGCHVIYTGTKPRDKSKDTSGDDFYQLDFLNDKSADTFINHIKKIPRIDILINNAGINIIDPIYGIEDQHWDRILKVNLTGCMRLMRDVSKIMIKNKNGGKILNISSIFGIVSKSQRGSYSASKAGLVGLTRAAALDLAPYNILVNALCPGFVKTELTYSILSPAEIKKIAADIPLRRFAHESEIAQVATFLCSDLNTYITGQAIVADGGFTSQ